MDVFTFEEAVRIVWESRILIAEVASGVFLLLVGRTIACRLEDAVGAPHNREEEVGSMHSTAATACDSVNVPQKPCLALVHELDDDFDNFDNLFDDFDKTLSAELEEQFSAVMSDLEAEQMQTLSEATVDRQDLMHEAVNAFGAELVREEKPDEPRRSAPAQGDAAIDEALERLEREVQRRVIRGSSRWSRRRVTPSPLLVASLGGALGLCGAYADRLQAAEIYSSSFFEAGIVFVFMPLGYVLFPRVLGSAFSAR